MTFSQLGGAVTILVTAVCCTFAYRTGKKGRSITSLWLIFAAGLILRMFAGADLHLNPWDERYHALAAKSLLDHPLTPTLYDNPALEYDYKEWTSSHIWIHKPPMTLWLIAVSLEIFGINEIAVRIPSILLSSLGIILVFFIAKHFFEEKTALLASFLFAINGLLIELAVGHQPTDHPDTIFAFFVLLGIFFSVMYKQRRTPLTLFLVGVSTGCAVLSKWLPGLVVIAVLVVLLLDAESWKKSMMHASLAFMIAVVVFLPWQIYIYTAFPREAAWESYFNYRHMFEPLEGHDGTVFYQLAMMPRIFGELVYLPVGYFFYTLYKKRIRKEMYALALWCVVPYLFFSFVATKMPGYVMMSAPPIFMMIAWAVWDVTGQLGKIKYRRTTIVALALLIVLPVRYTIERVKPFNIEERNPRWSQELRELQGRVGDSKAAVFNVEHNIEAMFYARVTAYPFIPDQHQIDEAMRRGFRIFVYDDSKLSPEVRNNPSITIIRRQ